MEPIKFVTNGFNTVKRNILQDHSYESTLWIVNLVPSFAGFSLKKPKITILSTPFFILNYSLLIYIYGIGSTVYQVYYAKEPMDYIKSFVSISIGIQVFNITQWWMDERTLLKSVLDNAEGLDKLTKLNPITQDKHVNSMRLIKWTLIIFYSVNHINAFSNYIPARSQLNNDFALQPCVGLEPLNISPNWIICKIILIVQELTIMMAALNYQTLLVFLISHTALMYRLLSDEIMQLNDEDDQEEVRRKLIFFIRRHTTLLDIVTKLRLLYKAPLGVNFISNAICIALAFYFDLKEMLTFLPITMYCFMVFFLYCYLCQKLINAAEEFETAVYSCGWENFRASEMKMVRFMLLSTQQKVELLAADIIPVNIYTFAATLQGMFKFVTVVKF